MDFSKRLIFLNKIIRALNQLNIRADKKTDVRKKIDFKNGLVAKFGRLIIEDNIITWALNIVNTKDSNKVNITKGPKSKDEIVVRIQSKMNTRILYRLDLFFFIHNYAKKFSFCNFTNILTNFFSNLLLILIDFGSFVIFSISSFYFTIFNSTNGSKTLDFEFFNSLAICNSGNIFAFYH